MTTTSNSQKQFTFTGWHMFAILVAFFGVVISVNLLMAYFANSSWSGILSKDTYVASQDFNIKAEQARAWAAEGFKGQFAVNGKVLEYRLQGPAAAIGELTSITAIFHRPVGDKQDFTLQLGRSGEGVFTSEHNLKPGQWIVDLAAIEGAKVVFHQATRIFIQEK